MDSGELRSGTESLLRGDGQSESRYGGTEQKRRQSFYVLDSGNQSRYREDRLVLPGNSARHARLGFDGIGHYDRRGGERQAAQAGGAGESQRIFLRFGPHQRRAHSYDSAD